MTTTYNYFFQKFFLWGLLLALTLLLSTPNFSVAVILSVAIFSIVYLYKNRNSIEISPLDIIICICFSFYFIGAIPITIVDGSTGRYLQGGTRLALCLPIYLSLRHELKQSKFNLKNHLELGVVFSSISTFILAVYQYFYLGMTRVDGFLYSINFGYLSCSIAFLALTLSFNSSRKAILIASFSISIISVILTLSRGAIFAIPILMILIVAICYKRVNTKLIVLGIVAFIASCLMTYNYSESFNHRINYTINEFSNIVSGDINKATSSGDRLQFWYGALQAFKRSPIIGLTYEKREQLNHKLLLEGKMTERPSKVSRGHAHNQYFEMLASNGILGFFSILSIFFIPFVIFAHHYLAHGSDWALSATVFVSGFAIFGLTEVPLTANLIGSFYGFMLAVFFAIIATEKHNKSVH